MAEQRSPYVWVSWLTALLAGEASCWWALWFKANHRYDKIEDKDFDRLTWNARHRDMVNDRMRQLRTDGYAVQIEDQNAFKLKGKTGTILAGKVDLVATKPDQQLFSDAKGTTNRQGKHIWQVLIYLFAEHLNRVRFQTMFNPPIAGELVYLDGILAVPGDELTDERKQRIMDAMRLVSGPAPDRVPSERECRFCSIGPADCPVRATADVVVDVDAF